MSDIKIDKNIPLPNESRGNVVYPFRDMEIGDSFVTSRKSVQSASHGYGLRHGMVFKTKEISPTEIRIWRVV